MFLIIPLGNIYVHFAEYLSQGGFMVKSIKSNKVTEGTALPLIVYSFRLVVHDI